MIHPAKWNTRHVSHSENLGRSEWLSVQLGGSEGTSNHSTLMSQASSGFLHPKPRGRAVGPWNNHHQISKDADTDFFSSAHVSVQCKSYFGTSARESSARQHAYSSAVLQGDRLGAAAQTFPLQNRCSSVPESDQQISSPLLQALLKQKPPDLTFFIPNPPSSSERNNANVELSTGIAFDGQRCESQQVAALSCGPTRMGDFNHSGGINFQLSSPSLSGPPSTDKVSPVGDMAPATDDEIHNFIAKRLAYFKTILNQENGHALGHSSQKEHVETRRLHCAEAEQCSSSAAAGQALRADSSNAEITSFCAPSTSGTHSTEYPQTLVTVAAACARHEDESPVALAAVSAAALDERTDKHPRSPLNRSSSREGHESPLLNISKSMDDISNLSCAPQCMTKRKNIDTALKPIDAAGPGYVRGATDVSEDLKTKSSSAEKDEQRCSVTCKEYIAHSKLNSPIHEVHIRSVASIHMDQSKWQCTQTSCGGPREDVAPVCSQTNLSVALSANEKVNEKATLSNSSYKEARICKDSQYEDISDEENVPKANSKQSLVDNEGYGCMQGQAKVKDGIISEEELIPKKQVLTSAETIAIAPHCACRQFVESDGCFEGLLCPKWERNQGWKTNHTPPCSSSFVWEDDDDDQIVIPISMTGLTFEPQDEDPKDGPEKVALHGGETGDKEKRCEPHCPGPKPAPGFASSQIEVFDTVDSFLQAKAVQFQNQSKMTSGWSTPEHEIDSEMEPCTPRFYSEHEDSCETEDSCDYSSGSEHNYLTVSRQFLKKRSAHLDTDDSVSEKEDDKKHRRLVDATVCKNHVWHNTDGKNVSENDDIIVIDSDTDDESDQNCKEEEKRRALFSSGSRDCQDAPCSPRRRQSPTFVRSLCGTVKDKLKKRRPSVDSPALQRQSKLRETQFKEVMQEACSDSSHSTEKSGQLVVTKDGTEQREIDGQKNSDEGSVIILDSDSEDDQNDRRANGEYGTAKEQLQETELSSDLSPPHEHQPVLHDTQFQEAMQDACSVRPQSTKKTELPIEADGDTEHVQRKANRQMSEERQLVPRDLNKMVKDPSFSERKANSDRTESSGAEDSDSTPFATKHRPATESVDRLCGTATKKPKKAAASSENSIKKWRQSADKGAGSPSGASYVIPRFVVQESSHNSHYFKLVKEDSKVLMEGKDATPETPTATRKMTDSRGKNRLHLDRHEEGRSAPKSKHANDRHHAMENKIQTNTAKPRPVSRQLSLPCNEGPSSSSGNLSSTSGQLSEARQSSASSSLLKSNQNTSIPRQHSSTYKLQRSLSCSNPSNLDHLGTHTKSSWSSATTQSSAKMRVKKDWEVGYHSIKMRRKASVGMDEDRRATNSDSLREARPRRSHYDKAPKLRLSSHKPVTRLMKRTMSDYMEWTMARRRDAPNEQRYSVGEGYKWSEKPTVAKLSGSSRQGKK